MRSATLFVAHDRLHECKGEPCKVRSRLYLDLFKAVGRDNQRLSCELRAAEAAVATRRAAAPRCAHQVPGHTAWMNPVARRPCIRRDGHKGFCRNTVLEWDPATPYPGKAWRRDDPGRKDVL